MKIYNLHYQQQQQKILIKQKNKCKQRLSLIFFCILKLTVGCTHSVNCVHIKLPSVYFNVWDLL